MRSLIARSSTVIASGAMGPVAKNERTTSCTALGE